MRAAVVLTASAGAPEAKAQQVDERRRVEAAFRRAGIEATITVVQGPELADAVRSAAASEADIVVVGGGDGSMSTAAAVLMEATKPLGVLPLGTLNHFAKDLGISLDLEEAVQTIAQGRAREIDVGDVNGHVFVNNSSIGLYPRAVDRRDEKQERQGWSKWPAMLIATLTVVRQFKLLRVSVHTGDQVLSLSTPFIFVGNNEYEMNLFLMGRRVCLDGGTLGLYLTKTVGRFGLVRLVFHALIGRLEQAEEFESRCLSAFEIQTNRRSVLVARDGEVTRMRPPLKYRIRPRALRVIAPPPNP